MFYSVMESSGNILFGSVFYSQYRHITEIVINSSVHIETIMDTSKLMFTCLQNRIFRLLCITAGISLNKREIARVLNVSPTAIAKAMTYMEREGFVIIEKVGSVNLTSIQLNHDNPKVLAFKRIDNLEQIYDSGLCAFLDEKFPGCAIILFGAYSSGKDTVGSDIDITIINSKEKDIDLTVYSKRLDRFISLNFYEDLSSIDQTLKSDILNGITLSGHIEL